MVQEWLKISLLLCTFGFFREMRPSEPFVSEFLSGEWRDIEPEQLYRDVYPIGTYTHLAVLIVIFLVTDILRYKSIIIFSACVGITIWSLLLWTTSLGALQAVQALYGTYMATEVAYYTYIYAKINRDKYQQVTGNTRAAILSGRFLASVIGQALVSTQAMDLRQLNYITVGALPQQHVTGKTSSATPTSAINPTASNPALNPPASAALAAVSAPKDEDEYPDGQQTSKQEVHFSCHRAGRLLWTHFIAAYSNLTVVQWSLWWSLAMAGFIQVQTYVQLLWQVINQDHDYLYNGGAEALLTLFGAISALLAGYVANRVFEQWALWILTGCSALQGGLILYSSFATNIWVAYVVYILFGVLYMFMITMASASVAKHLEEDSFGLIFGINTFLALAFQTILTVVVISESGLALDMRGQFKVYGGYFLVLAVIYFVPATVSSVQYCRRKSRVGRAESEESGKNVTDMERSTRF
ncbi:thiamine transporter 1-like isoform X2 [Uranotaenia lowii]|uniref:thiamine transporter 1-like isoform X2 n=1 Tax=Uranotaenia lowii TaxID=190385 RepID=UPI00247A5C8C|nr:thiamine transporter 1-like isoform X2 [Uranotaenia lowii]